MKDKSKKTNVKKDTGRKVFDVMKPGNSMVSATSRPVIVGHKPQVKDPMMAEDNKDQKQLMDSKQKVIIAPAPPASEPIAPPAADADVMASAPPIETTEVPSGLAAMAMPPDVVEKTPEETPLAVSTSPSSVPEISKTSDQSVEPTSDQPSLEATMTTDVTSETSQDVLMEQSSATPQVSKPTDTGTVGVVYDEPPVVRQPKVSSPNAEPLPVLPDEPYQQQIIVSHHGKKRSAGKVLASLLLILIAGAIVLDILLDAGFVTIESLPHTNFF